MIRRILHKAPSRNFTKRLSQNESVVLILGCFISKEALFIQVGVQLSERRPPPPLHYISCLSWLGVSLFIREVCIGKSGTRRREDIASITHCLSSTESTNPCLLFSVLIPFITKYSILDIFRIFDTLKSCLIRLDNRFLNILKKMMRWGLESTHLWLNIQLEIKSHGVRPVKFNLYQLKHLYAFWHADKNLSQILS